MRGVEKLIALLAKVLSEMEDHLGNFASRSGNFDFAAASDVNWHGGAVEEWYYKFYAGTTNEHKYPAEMQEAVQLGQQDFLQAQAYDEQVAFNYDTAPGDDQGDDQGKDQGEEQGAGAQGMVQLLARGDSIGPSLSQISEDSDILYPSNATEDEDIDM